MNTTLELLIIVLLLGIMAEIYLLTEGKTKRFSRDDSLKMLVDTSVLMDGRVVDLAKTGFLLGQVIVPRSVLGELQLLADGSDHAKRERARFGMDAMKELKDVLGGQFTLLDDEQRIPEGVDNRLLQLARDTGAAILTIDYNLNKVAQVEGIQILNINELAKSLRMSHLPGDTLELALTQKGQDNHQAVGYLKDGTMVVVEQAKKFIGQMKHIEIIRSLQTDAGKMMFAKLVVPNSTTAKPQPATANAPTKQRSLGRRLQTLVIAESPVKKPQPTNSQSSTAARTKAKASAPASKRTSNSPSRPTTAAQQQAAIKTRQTAVQRSRSEAVVDDGAAKNKTNPGKTRSTRSTKTKSETAATHATPNSRPRRSRPKTSAQREAALVRLANGEDQ